MVDPDDDRSLNFAKQQWEEQKHFLQQEIELKKREQARLEEEFEFKKTEAGKSHFWKERTKQFWEEGTKQLLVVIGAIVGAVVTGF